jgi:hypothetical protein
MGRIYEAVRSYFQDTDWTFEERPDEDLIIFPVTGNNGHWLGFAKAFEEHEQLLVHSVLPEPVPADRRAELSLFLTRANFGTAIGNFELDLDEGELRYKTSVDLEGSEAQVSLIRQLMLANVVTTDLYLPAITAVLKGEDATQAMKDLEDKEA